jgi:phosphatidylglycerol:prolipoprotein diacylglycerol transferase
MFPTLIRIGQFQLASYGLFVAAGYLAAILYLRGRRSRMGLDEDRFWSLIYCLFFGAVAGGKLLYWALDWRSLVSGSLHPWRDFRYGFVFYGGFCGAAAAGALALRRMRLSFWASADYFAVAVPLGHAIGRLGCFAAGCCAGRPSLLPWAVRFTRPDCLVSPALLGVPLHPVQLYESAGNLALAAALAGAVSGVEKGRLPAGTAAVAYLAGYAALRFLLEFFRGDDRGAFWLGLSPSQWIAAACAVGALAYFALRAARGALRG